MSTPITEEPVPIPIPETEKEGTLKDLLRKTMEEKIKITPLLQLMVLELTTIKMDTLEKIEALLMKILEDKKLDAKDVPTLIVLFVELNDVYATLKIKNITPTDCATVIKIIAAAMYDLKFREKMTEKERDAILEGFNLIIDTVVTLVDLKTVVAPKMSCFPFVCGK
uniref:Uncharacterized protein n=1 Tax=viral metagenome TaxID=1070528 RepID=A0A6C0HIE4_9ZZZZ